MNSSRQNVAFLTRKAVHRCITYGAIAILLAIMLLNQRKAEPYYLGRSLSYWLKISSTNHDTDQVDQAQEALNTIGTNAIPFLLRLLRSKDSSLNATIGKLIEKQHLVDISFSSSEENHELAEFGFHVLRERASNSVTSLIHIYREDISITSQRSTLAALNAIGGAAVEAAPVFAEASTNSDTTMRARALVWLIAFHPDRDSVYSTIFRGLNDPAPMVRLYVVRSLERNRVKGLAAPLLKTALKDTDLMVRRYAIKALKQTDEDVGIIAIELEKALADPNDWIRLDVIDTLSTLGSLSPSARNVLSNLLMNSDKEVREEAGGIVFRSEQSKHR